MPQANQHRPSVPDDILRPLVESYYAMGIGDTEMVKLITDDLELHKEDCQWTLIPKTIYRRRKEWNLPSTRQQAHTVESIAPKVAEMQEAYGGGVGYKRMKDYLRADADTMMVSRHVIGDYNRLVDEQGVQRREKHKLKRRRFFVAGVMDVLAMDQHDKFARFGLCLHIGTEAYSNWIAWLKVWWTNSNPRLIFSYYLEAARVRNAIPLLTQSDPGSENNCTANGHTILRQRCDPSLEDTIQHNWMKNHGNVKPEIRWSGLRREWSPGFEALFDEGVNNGWYDVNDSLEKVVFRWIAIPWLQSELDKYRNMFNTSKPRANPNKILPVDRPQLIYYNPERYGAEDFKVHVTDEDLDYVEAMYSPPDHPVFQLVPETFDREAQRLYEELGSPRITRQSFWTVYRDLLAAFDDLNADLEFQQELAANEEVELTVIQEVIDVIPGKPVRRGGAAAGQAGKEVSDLTEGGEEEVADGQSDGDSEYSSDEHEENILQASLTHVPTQSQ